jgi:hypothetical protein
MSTTTTPRTDEERRAALVIHSNLCGLIGHATECPFYEPPVASWLPDLQEARRLLRDVIANAPDEVVEVLAPSFAGVDRVHAAILDGTL